MHFFSNQMLFILRDTISFCSSSISFSCWVDDNDDDDARKSQIKCRQSDGGVWLHFKLQFKSLIDDWEKK
jgi:hypothetical protein